jgi:mRNA interferase MazF
VLILTRGSIIDVLSEVTVAPVTRTIRDIPSEVRLSRTDGMPHECAVNTDHLQTVAKNKLGALITTLPPARMKEVSTAVRFALQLT